MSINPKEKRGLFRFKLDLNFSSSPNQIDHGYHRLSGKINQCSVPNEI